MYPKKSGRVTFRSNRRPPFKRSNNFSNGKTRNKGNVSQQYEKYIKLAKDASTSGDRIQSEYYYQFADHYSRLMIELGISIEDEDNNNESFEIKSNDNKEDNENADNNENSDVKLNEEKQVDESDDHESIESVPFISDPIKKKVAKSKKT
tara:strand:+ start:506 stop:955 length:450 start_codon:yes stop_codon:yes gene_type:complete